MDTPQSLETPQKAVSGDLNPIPTPPVSAPYGDIPAFAFADQHLADFCLAQITRVAARDKATAAALFAVTVLGHATDAFRTAAWLALAKQLTGGPHTAAINLWIEQVENELADISCTPIDSPLFLIVKQFFIAGKDAELSAEMFCKERPADADARWVYATTLAANKKYAAALKEQIASLQLKPMAARMIAHAIDLNRAGNFKLALQAAILADVLRPNCPRIKTELAAYFLVNGAYDLARRTAEYVYSNFDDTGAAAKAYLLASATYCNGSPAGIPLLEKAIELAPHWKFARLSLGEEQIRLGNWKDGWRNYLAIGEMGNESAGIGGAPAPSEKPVKAPTQPMWKGELLAGKSICVKKWAGYGDQIQFLRFALKLISLGAKVTWVVAPALEALFKTFHPAVEIATNEPKADFYAWPYELPHYLGINASETPYQFGHYLIAKPAEKQNSPYKQVGLCWAGNPAFAGDRERSAPLAAFAPLAQTPNTRLYSLQKGKEAGQIESVKFTIDGTFLDGVETFADTAAQIEKLDLVITVDTAIAHLAGALGKPVWLLLPFKGDFRWGALANRTLWYSSMRLWRQSDYNDWAGLLARVTDALCHWVPVG